MRGADRALSTSSASESFALAIRRARLDAAHHAAGAQGARQRAGVDAFDAGHAVALQIVRESLVRAVITADGAEFADDETVDLRRIPSCRTRSPAGLTP